MAHRNIVGEQTGHRGDFFLVRDTADAGCYIPCTSKFRLPEIDLGTAQASSRLMQVASGYGAYPPVLACGVENTHCPKGNVAPTEKEVKTATARREYVFVSPGKEKACSGPGPSSSATSSSLCVPYPGVRGKFGGWTLAVLVLCLWLNKGNAAKGRAPQATRNALAMACSWPLLRWIITSERALPFDSKQGQHERLLLCRRFLCSSRVSPRFEISAP